MIGDKLVITQYHRDNGKVVAEAALKMLETLNRPIAVTIAGESGSGKSETAATTAEFLEEKGRKTIILGQDDYFRLPPKSNSARRKAEIEWVGIGEVRLDLMDQHLNAVKNGEKEIAKPLIYFEEDRVGEEHVSLDGVLVVIAEGTYTTSLGAADLRAFIDATYHHTLEHRKKRARDAIEGAFIEQVLEIEHKIISAHKALADVLLPPNPDQ
jgi:uridine kinase